MTVHRWKFSRVLPNLSLEKPIENAFLAIVPASDSRLSELRSDPRVTRLLDHFTDVFSRQIRPTVLLTRADAPHGIGLEAIIAFRNAAALNAISYAWLGRLLTHNTISTQWSDYWDIYPVGLGKGDFLVVNSPAVGAIEDTDDFKGQCSPYIASPGHHSVGQDQRLAKLLSAAWDEAFLNGSENEWWYLCLHRSMAMAYQACRIPIYNNSILYDFGTGLSLWVSAFECLTHPGPGKRATLFTVLDLLRPIPFKDPALQTGKFQETVNKNPRPMNLAEHLYWQLYKTRNDFLHGNQVGPEALFAFRDEPDNSVAIEAPTVEPPDGSGARVTRSRQLHRPTMEALIPLVYRLALLEYLKPAQSTDDDYDPAFEILTKPDFEKALASALRAEARW